MTPQLTRAINSNMESIKEMITDFARWCREKKYPIDGISFEIYIKHQTTK